MACIVKGICCSTSANSNRACACSIRTITNYNNFCS